MFENLSETGFKTEIKNLAILYWTELIMSSIGLQSIPLFVFLVVHIILGIQT